MKRRDFFRRALGFCGVLALAPQIAFRAATLKPKVETELLAYWHQSSRICHQYTEDYLDALRCSLTRATIQRLSPSDFESFWGKEEAA